MAEEGVVSVTVFCRLLRESTRRCNCVVGRVCGGGWRGEGAFWESGGS